MPIATESQRKTKRASSIRRSFGIAWLIAWLALGGLFLWRGLGGPTEFAPSVSAAPIAVEQHAQLTKPIEQVRIGERVMGANPLFSDEERNVPEPHPATWRHLKLRMTKDDGGRLDIELLRPLTWLQTHGIQSAATVELNLAELGASGSAEVISIEPCASIAPGVGHVVTGTFKHSSRAIIDVHVQGQDKPIGCTDNHPFWSEDRQEFIPAGQLRIGERLRTATGQTIRVSDIIRRGSPQPVYNIEVHGEHVYHVTSTGILVHNSNVPRRTANYTQQSRSHVFGSGHAANSPRIPGQSRFRPTEGGQKFTNEVLNHPNVRRTPQGNGRILYEVDDLGRITGRNRAGNTTRGGAVVIEGPNPQPWSTYVPDEVVTQFPL